MATFEFGRKITGSKRSFRKAQITIGADGWKQELIDACTHEKAEVTQIYATPLPHVDYGDEVEVWETVDDSGWLEFLEDHYSEIYGVQLTESWERSF